MLDPPTPRRQRACSRGIVRCLNAVLVLGTVLVLGAVLGAQELSRPPASAGAAVEDLLHESGQKVEDAWLPMGATAPARVVRRAGREVVGLDCNFGDTTGERASWDRHLRIDLSRHRAVELQIFCRDLRPISRLSLYFKSGAGWYHASVEGIEAGRWCTVRVEKSAATIEGNPSGWGNVETLRLSAWRGGDTDTELYLAGMSLVGGAAPVAVVRCESLAGRGSSELRSAIGYCRGISGILDDLGVPHDLLGDEDLDARALEGRKILVLPHNPTMPDAAAAAVGEFLGDGGRLLGFYQLPRQLREAVGIRSGRLVRGEGAFAAIRCLPEQLPGAPAEVRQRSWNIVAAEAVPGRSEVAAWWYDQQGEPSGHAAIVVSDCCIQMTHVLLEDDPAGKRRLVLAMLGRFLPEVWHRAASVSVERIGRVGPFTDWKASRAAIAAGGRAAAGALDEAERAKRSAEEFLRESRWTDAIAAAAAAREATTRAWCATLEPAPDEHRAFWCHSAFGVDGMSWDEAIRILADNGFTAVLPNMLWGGVAYYPSEVLPVASSVTERGDQIEECLAACRRHGVECHVWKVNWNMSSRSPAAFRSRMLRDGRSQVAFDGEARGEWLCPSHPQNQRLEIEAMVEVATNYQVDGVHFDYIRYPGNDSCYCAGCRARFEERLGRPVAAWPHDVRHGDAALQRSWQDFRRANITAVVAGVSRRLRTERPDVEISAAVFSNLPLHRDSVAQDWGEWCSAGYLDFVCPMDYTPDTAQFALLVERQLEWAGEVACYPGIGLSTWDAQDELLLVVEKIQAARRLGTGGFTVFNYGVREAREIVPLLGLGITRR